MALIKFSAHNGNAFPIFVRGQIGDRPSLITRIDPGGDGQFRNEDGEIEGFLLDQGQTLRLTAFKTNNFDDPLGEIVVADYRFTALDPIHQMPDGWVETVHKGNASFNVNSFPSLQETGFAWRPLA